VILQVRPDARQIVLDVDADHFEVRLRADARQQEQVRRADATGGQNHFAVGADTRDSCTG
jgi:hypothetical protein